MAKRHGNKVHYQVLLSPHRSDLLEQEADRRGIPTTSYVRELVYRALEREHPAYKQAAAKDELVRLAGIRRQTEGRMAARNAA